MKINEENDLLKVDEEYGVDQVDSLENLEPVRLRASMYIGSTSQRGVTHLIWEVLDNSVDENVAGYGDEIDLFVYKDCSVEVRDHGRGIPVGPHRKWKNPDGTPMDTLTGILTKLHAGGKFGDNGYKCFKENSIVNTINGSKKIQDINSNDYIINAYNESDKVADKFEYDYNGNINEIILDNNKSIEAIDGHYILIQRDNKLYWEEIQNIKETDLLIELEENDDVEELKRIIPKYEIIKY